MKYRPPRTVNEILSTPRSPCPAENPPAGEPRASERGTATGRRSGISAKIAGEAFRRDKAQPLPAPLRVQMTLGGGRPPWRSRLF
jgi:hypothetical protein